jgi:glycine/D-amino acid oxidase-like deaminating enzyme
VPAYRSGPNIRQTLRSLQRQTHREFLVRIAVEPPAQETLDSIAPFLADSRFQVSLNPTRLGWDGNIRSLLSRVDTPAFLVLPHDDMLHSRAIEVLLRELEKTDEAAVAYGDMQVFGVCTPFRKLVDLPRNATREEQILAFFLAGAEAVPWRGVARSTVISHAGGFPVDGFKGFAVECEWALRLLLAGSAIRVPRRLYFKRIQAPNPHSASHERTVSQTPAQRAVAWERHRAQMLALAGQGVPRLSTCRPLVELAAELAMLQRRLNLANLPLTAELSARAQRLAAQADSMGPQAPSAVHLATSFRRLTGSGQADEGDTVSTRMRDHGAATSVTRPLPNGGAAVGVLGAGIMGCCLALELALRGNEVDLIDLAPEPMTGASLHNEGKLHLGFVYANDPLRKTHGILAGGSLAFSRILERLTGCGAEALLPSKPFHYFVPNDGLLDGDAVASHFHEVERVVLELARGSGDRYLGRDLQRLFEINSSAEHARLFSPRTTSCSFRTEERAVSPSAVAGILRRAISSRPEVSFLGAAEVLAVERLSGGGVKVDMRSDGRVASKRYDCVANCLWDDKLRVDRTAGVADPDPWLLRYKATLAIAPPPDRARSIPSATGILGPYGDVVHHADGSIYLSWYSLARRAQTTNGDGRKLHDDVHSGTVARALKRWTARSPVLSSFLASVAHQGFFRDSVRAMATHVPSVAGLIDGRTSFKVGGGVILARGSTDIDDPASFLHQRSAIGPAAHGSYVTIDTGKYGMAPTFAMTAADLIGGILS